MKEIIRAQFGRFTSARRVALMMSRHDEIKEIKLFVNNGTFTVIAYAANGTDCNHLI